MSGAPRSVKLMGGRAGRTVGHRQQWAAVIAAQGYR